MEANENIIHFVFEGIYGDNDFLSRALSIAGLAGTFGVTLNIVQAWVLWNLSNLETKIISIERILQYSSIPSEPPLDIEENKPMQLDWPMHGEVHICDRFAEHIQSYFGMKCWFLVGLNIILLLVGKTTASHLERFYYEQGGNTK